MKRFKGCLNSECSEYRTRYFAESDEYCVKCGSKLSYVCKHSGCFKRIPDEMQEKYCPIHIAERRDTREKIWDGVKKVGAAVGTICVTVAAVLAGTEHSKKK